MENRMMRHRLENKEYELREHAFVYTELRVGSFFESDSFGMASFFISSQHAASNSSSLMSSSSNLEDVEVVIVKMKECFERKEDR